jgi:hypothetical protein
MHSDIIDRVMAEDLQVGDFIEQGEVLAVGEDEIGEYILVTVDGEDEPIEFLWDSFVNLYGDFSVEV